MGLNHEDIIVDSDALCKIDISTRKIIPQTPRVGLSQYNHNSERIGFTIDRYIDGHDMSYVDRVAIKYMNGSNSDMYIVDDLHLSDDEQSVIFSWLVSGNATQIASSIIFIVNFRCYDDNGTITYNWSTQPCSTYSVTKGVFSMDSNPQDLYDFWARYEDKVNNVMSTTEDLENRTSTLRKDVSSLENRVDVLETNTESLESITSNLSKKVPVLEGDVGVLEEIIPTLESRVDTIDRTLADDTAYAINKELTSIKGTIGNYNNSIIFDKIVENTYIGVDGIPGANTPGYYYGIAKIPDNAERIITNHSYSNEYVGILAFFDSASPYSDTIVGESYQKVEAGHEYLIPSGAKYFTMSTNSIDTISCNYVTYNFSTREEYDEMCSIINSRLNESPVLTLPTKYYAVVGDTLEIFISGILNVPNYEDYYIQFIGNANKGHKYKRKWVYTPSVSDTDFELTIKVFDRHGKLLTSGNTMIVITQSPLSPINNTNILAIGDSLTEDGCWVEEVNRRLTADDGTPIGNGISNVSFIGTKGSSVKYEGTGGWTWNSYCSSGSPFYNEATNELDFDSYCENIDAETIDIAVVLLGWNSILSGNVDVNIEKGKEFVNALHSSFPNCKVIISGLQMPSEDGYGYAYGINSNGNSLLAYHELKSKVVELNAKYEEWCMEDNYKSFMHFSQLSGQFDMENAYPYINVPVNTRYTNTEKRPIDGIHPSSIGDNSVGVGKHMIADAMYRVICSLL